MQEPQARCAVRVCCGENTVCAGTERRGGAWREACRETFVNCSMQAHRDSLLGGKIHRQRVKFIFKPSIIYLNWTVDLLL